MVRKPKFSADFTGINNLFKLEMREHIISTFKWKIDPLCCFGKKKERKHLHSKSNS